MILNDFVVVVSDVRRVRVQGGRDLTLWVMERCEERGCELTAGADRDLSATPKSHYNAKACPCLSPR